MNTTLRLAVSFMAIAGLIVLQLGLPSNSEALIVKQATTNTTITASTTISNSTGGTTPTACTGCHTSSNPTSSADLLSSYAPGAVVFLFEGIDPNIDAASILAGLGNINWADQPTVKFWKDTDGNITGASVEGNVAPVPEPSTILLIGAGFAGIAGLSVRRRMKNKKNCDK